MKGINETSYTRAFTWEGITTPMQIIILFSFSKIDAMLYNDKKIAFKTGHCMQVID